PHRLAVRSQLHLAATKSPFFISGGTLPLHATSYVERQADRDLLDSARNGEFCYVLNTRQMGKSSLMVRSAARLRDEGFRVAILDLTGIGQNLQPDQWYNGLMLSLGMQLDLEDEIYDFSKSQQAADIGPMQRWLEALRQVVLPVLEAQDKRLMIFVDEIDAVRALPFPSDEFFAGIRES